MMDYTRDGETLAPKEKMGMGDERLRARDMAVEMFRQLLSHSPEDGIVWQSTARDLVELTHEVWLTGLIMDNRGRQMTFKAMVHHIFNILHAREPASPTGVVNVLRNRKCMKTLPVLERYANLLRVRRGMNPMLADLRGWPEKPC